MLKLRAERGNNRYSHSYGVGEGHPSSMKKQPECTKHVNHKEEKYENREQPAHEQIPRWEHTRRLSSDDETSADAHNDEIKNARDDGHSFYPIIDKPFRGPSTQPMGQERQHRAADAQWRTHTVMMVLPNL